MTGRNPNLTYHAKTHAYQRTSSYLFAQLFPYIGNKRKLLPLIARAVERTGVRGGTFADLYAGTGVVSRMAKTMGFRVVCNDWEPYAAAFNGCFIGLNRPPIDPGVFDELNHLKPVAGFVTDNYCPADDLAANPHVERLFYTRENGMRIDAIRSCIELWRGTGRIDAAASDYLLAPLISAASFVSNTSGVFKAYHNGWGGATKTAHYRILSRLTLSPPPLHDNELDNLVLRDDALCVAENWQGITGAAECDIAYLDPPYNQHPYGSNYHLLNTITLYDRPEVPSMADGKSAIRTDWRTQRRSAFNHRPQALPALAATIDAIPARWILISYSTDGNIPVADLLAMASARGALEIECARYKRYRVSTQRMSPRSHNVEFVLMIDRHGQPRLFDADRCLGQILSPALRADPACG